MGIATLQKPFIPIDKLHSQAAIRHYLQVVSSPVLISTHPCATQFLITPSHFSELNKGSISADERGGIPNIQVFLKTGIYCQSSPSSLIKFSS